MTNKVSVGAANPYQYEKSTVSTAYKAAAYSAYPQNAQMQSDTLEISEEAKMLSDSYNQQSTYSYNSAVQNDVEQTLYTHNPEGIHPMLRAENRFNTLTFTMHSNATGGNVIFRALRDGTMWASENGGQRPEDFRQIDPNQGVAGIPQAAIREMYYSMRLNQNMPIMKYANGVQGDVRQLVNSFVSLKNSLGSEQHNRFIEDAFRNLANNIFSVNGALNIGDRANIFVDEFLSNYRTNGVQEAFDNAWAASNKAEGDNPVDKPWLTDISSQEFSTMRRFSRELLHSSGTSREANHSLEVSLQLLVNAFKPMHEALGDDFSKNRELYQEGFRSAVGSVFLWESERTFRRDTRIDTEDGRVSNWEALNHNTQVMEGNSARASQLSALFFDNLDAYGVQGAFEIAMATMGLTVPEAVSETEEKAEAPVQPPVNNNDNTTSSVTAAPQATSANSAPAAPQATAASSTPVAQPTSAQNATPDIDVSNYRNWDDPRVQEKVDILNQVFGQRAAESMRTSDPVGYAWARYFDPRAPHFVGHDLCQAERSMSFSEEHVRIVHLRLGTGSIPTGGWLANPIFEGRGLGRSDGNVPRKDYRDINTDRRAATTGLLMRRAVNGQLNDLFQRNGIVIPENLRLSFTIDIFYRLRVTGTDDENLKKQIEDVLNKNDNAFSLWGHIFESLRSAHYITTAEPPTGQLNNGFERAFWLDSMLRQYTGYSMRHDLEFVDGKFLTKDGENILEIVAKVGDKHIAAYLIAELAWMINAGGPENMPDLTLTIDFENGRLFDVGQRNGYGPGQTGWIDNLGGTMHDESLLE